MVFVTIQGNKCKGEIGTRKTRAHMSLRKIMLGNFILRKNMILQLDSGGFVMLFMSIYNNIY